VSPTHEELLELQKQHQRVKEPEKPLTPQQEQMLKLQTGVGNAALARAILARDLQTPGVGKLAPRKDMDSATKMKVVAYLSLIRTTIDERVQHGTMSMPELVNMVRQSVPESLTYEPFDIELVISETLGGLTPPYSRRVVTADGRSAEVEASILNKIPKPPKELKIYAGPGSLTFGFSGEATIKAGPVSVQGDKDGGSVTVKDGDTSVTGKGAFTGDSFGLKASVKGLSFDAQIRKDSGTKEWSKFNATVKIPIAGGETVEERPPSEEITAAVLASEAAIKDVIAHIASGGSPSDEVVKSKMALIKPGLEKVTEAVEKRKGPQASLKITVGTGDPKLGNYGMVGLVIEF
jgi:hypothetical protein